MPSSVEDSIQGSAKAGHRLLLEDQGEVCSKVGVTETIRAAAKRLGQPLVDPGVLYLHSGHAMCVTGAQALARAGLTEHFISLLARWGSSAVRTYIRKAPLAASHRMPALAIAGWDRSSNPAAATASFHG